MIELPEVRIDDTWGFTWDREDGTEVSIGQYQGLDYLLRQARRDEEKFLTSYSDPGFHLYAALFSFLRDRSKLPPFEEIQTIADIHTEVQETGFPIRAGELVYSAMNPLPRIEDGEITYGEMPFVGGHINPRISYSGILKDEHFLIVSETDGDEYSYGHARIGLEEHFDLLLAEALLVMKGIFNYTRGCSKLQKLHELVEGRQDTL